MDNNSVNRRDFLKQASLMVMAVSMPIVSCSSKEEVGPALRDDCYTTTDILGPYYKAGSPFRDVIIPADNSTEPLIIHGKVFSGCDQLLEDAVVEIWNADEDGNYDVSDQYRFRGSFRTMTDGKYQFRTIVPGRYLNGAQYRPSHLHFRVTASGHEALVSQVYFADDPYIDDDPWASDPKAEARILVLEKDQDNTDTVNFDIYLNRM